MSSLGSQKKQPIERIDFDIDYSDWLLANDGIVQIDVAVSPPGLLLPKTNVASPLVKIWTDGGRDGATYKITVTATTDDGRIKQDEFTLKVKET
jgi:hypothetical protein